MEKTDSKEFGILIRKLALAYNYEVKDQQILVYFEGLNDLSIGSIRIGISEVIKSYTFGFPNIAVIRKVCPDIKPVKLLQIPDLMDLTEEERQYNIEQAKKLIKQLNEKIKNKVQSTALKE